MKKIIIAVFAAFYSLNVNAQVIPGDFADPSIIRVDSVYYAAGTSSEWAPYFPVFKSADLKFWRPAGYVFDKAPEWTNGSFWAPEYYKINDTYYIYYTARRKSDNHSFIGVATSKFPDHGFTDHGIIIEHGKEAIDPFIFDDNGQLYITFKAYGLEDRPIELLGYKLSADGLKTEGEYFPLLKDENRAGMEGQSILKKDNYYYIFYSAGNCCGGGCSYSVNVARSASLKGPYEYYNGNPLLSENKEWKCMGHGTFVTAEKGNMFYLHHGYNKESNVFTGREGLLSSLSWKSGWPVLKAQSSGVKANVVDEFNGKTLAGYWQWDFRHTTPVAYLQKGFLHLNGTVTDDNPTGVALTVRPTNTNFEMITEVINRNPALRGLVVYGDANASIGIGVQGDSVVIWKVQGKQREVLQTLFVKTEVIRLLIRVRDGNMTFAYKSADRFRDLLTIPVPGFLPQWDRSPRLGLHFSGDKDNTAQFSFFRIDNK